MSHCGSGNQKPLYGKASALTRSCLEAVTRAARHAYAHSKVKATVRRGVRRKPLGEGRLYTEVQTWKSSRYSVNFEYKSWNRPARRQRRTWGICTNRGSSRLASSDLLSWDAPGSPAGRQAVWVLQAPADPRPLSALDALQPHLRWDSGALGQAVPPPLLCRPQVSSHPPPQSLCSQTPPPVEPSPFPLSESVTPPLVILINFPSMLPTAQLIFSGL